MPKAVLFLFVFLHIALSGMICVGLAGDHMWLPFGYELAKAVLAAGVAIFLWRLAWRTTTGSTPSQANPLLLAGLAVLAVSFLADSTLLNLDRTWHRSDTTAVLQTLNGR